MPLNIVSFVNIEETNLKVNSGKKTMLKNKSTGKFELFLASNKAQNTPVIAIAVKK
jgi:hypothetical protein